MNQEAGRSAAALASSASSFGQQKRGDFVFGLASRPHFSSSQQELSLVMLAASDTDIQDIPAAPALSSSPPQPATADVEDVQTALFPEDIYTREGTYWADLPAREQSAWIHSHSNAEAKRELGVLGRMVKADPLSPLGAYFHRYVLTGMVTHLIQLALISSP